MDELDELFVKQVRKAIYETYKSYGKLQATDAICFNLTENSAKAFTRKNGAREEVLRMPLPIFKKALLNMGARYIEENSEEEVDTESIKADMRDKIENITENNNYVWLREFCEFIATNAWIEENRELGNGEVEDAPIIITREMQENIKKVQSEMITGLMPCVEGSIELDGTCYATTSIGVLRENQEDATILAKDGVIPDLKILAVADGVGGYESGEKASHILVDSLKYWLEHLSEEERNCYYTGMGKLQEGLNARIKSVGDMIDFFTNNRGGTTFTCAVVGENDTLIANVGDSRAYIVKDGKLEQVSQEDTEVHEKYERGEIPSKELMRFHRDANIITQCVGCGQDFDVHFNVINNKDYDMMLLFSDGTTDCLSEEEIAIICKTTDKNQITKKLVEKAFSSPDVPLSKLDVPDKIKYSRDYRSVIAGGKDNITSAAYIPNKDAKEEER